MRGLAKTTKRQLRSFLSKKLPWVLHSRRKDIYDAEYVSKIFPYFCNAEKLSVDVGAALGTFTQVMLQHSAKVVGFEPNDIDFAYLKGIFSKDIQIGKLQLFNCAVSDSNGTSQLVIPNDSYALGSIHQAKTAEFFRSQTTEVKEVQTTALRSMVLQNIGFIKIDVEGHELEVVRGALELIERDRPNIYVEIEERHAAGNLKAINTLLSEYGYQGYFQDGYESIRRISEKMIEELEMFQKQSDLGTIEYINNFLFIQPDQANYLLERIRRLA